MSKGFQEGFELLDENGGRGWDLVRMQNAQKNP
jgi:hypothetical protein